jgi:hypothetical protein
MMKKFFQLHPKSIVMISLVPPIIDIVKFNHTYNNIFSCNKFRKSFCKQFRLQGVLSSKLTRRHREINKIIVKIFDQYKSIYKGTLLLLDKVKDINFLQADIAYDCFHPSENGHIKIGNALGKSFKEKIDYYRGR